MNALFLKLLALLLMLVDHSGVVLARLGLIGMPLYRVMRIIGRGAFPIFCFQLAEGAKYTKKKWFYLLRIVVLALVSETFFDLALFASWYDPYHQNVFFTLALGLVTVYMIQWASKFRGWLIAAGGAAACIVLTAASLLAKYVLRTDYGASGVLQIGIMGLLVLPLERIPYFSERAFSIRLIRVIVCACAITVCAWLLGGTEWWAYYALLPIGLYNGKKGYRSRALQYGLYFFYPVHLLILGLIFAAFRR